jgi:lysophospholipase L1-like esterase
MAKIANKQKSTTMGRGRKLQQSSYPTRSKSAQLQASDDISTLVNTTLTDMMTNFKLTPAKLILNNSEIPEQPLHQSLLKNINVSIDTNLIAGYPDDWDTGMTDSPPHSIRISATNKPGSIEPLDRSIEDIDSTLVCSTQEELNSMCISKINTPDYPNYKKWHIMSLRAKLNKLGKNDRGSREELITRLDAYYRDLPKSIREANNAWICEDIDKIVSPPDNQEAQKQQATSSTLTQSEPQTNSDDILPQLMIEIVNILEILSQQYQPCNPQAGKHTTLPRSNTESNLTDVSLPKLPSKNEYAWKQVAGKPKSNKHKQFQLKLNNSFEALQTTTANPLQTFEDPEKKLSPSRPELSRRKHERPQIVINNQPKSTTQTWSKTTPGNSSYAAVANNNKKLALFSDSMCNRMGKHELRRKLKCAVNKKAFPGATSIDMHSHYMMPTLEKDVPDTAIIHTGINDVIQQSDKDGGLTAEAIAEISSNVIKCGQVCRMYGVNKVCVSSIIHKKGVKTQAAIILINDALARLCVINSFDFLSNVNIPYTEPKNENSLFYTDGLHLNDNGRDLLISNFVEYLNTD